MPVLTGSRRFRAEPAKSGNRIRHRNTASMFRCVSVGIRPYFLTWAGWRKNWPKIQGVYTEVTPIYEWLKKVTRQFDHDVIPMSFISKQTTAGDGQKQNLDQLQPSFMYSVLFKEIVWDIVEDNNYRSNETTGELLPWKRYC